MASNIFVDFYTESSEQDLLQDLVQEAVRFAGHDCWYLPRTVVNRDEIFTEPEYGTYDSAFLVDFYIKTTTQMGGEGALMSKFGFELRDELVLTISKKTFQEEILDERPDVLRPREGDLIFIPMIGSMFTIKYVDKKAFFYQLGDLQAYDLTMELYEGQSEVFNTGVPEIDAIYQPITRDINAYALTTEDGYEIHDEYSDWPIIWQADNDQIDISQNLVFEDKANKSIDWSETEPFSEHGKW